MGIKDMLPQPPWKGPPIPKSLRFQDIPLHLSELVSDIGEVKANRVLLESLSVYEKIARQLPVSYLELAKSNIELAILIISSLKWMEGELSVEEEKVPRQVARELRTAQSRADMVTALDKFWGYYHDQPENVIKDFKEWLTPIQARAIKRRLDVLASRYDKA